MRKSKILECFKSKSFSTLHFFLLLLPRPSVHFRLTARLFFNTVRIAEWVIFIVHKRFHFGFFFFCFCCSLRLFKMVSLSEIVSALYVLYHRAPGTGHWRNHYTKLNDCAHLPTNCGTLNRKPKLPVIFLFIIK